MTASECRPAEVFPPGEFIREELAARGWSQAELARRTGLPDGTIRPVVNGYCPISPATAERLAAALGGTAAYWLNLDRQYRGVVLRDACEVCGKAIQSRRSSRRFCGYHCQQRVWRQQRRQTQE